MNGWSGKRGPTDEQHYLASVPDKELLKYMHELSSEMERLAGEKGYSDLSRILNLAVLRIEEILIKSNN